MRQPYIGVTGFMSRQEIEEVLTALYENETDRNLMVGVLASTKTLDGEKGKYPNRYPDIDDIKRIFMPHPRCLNLIHYTTKDTKNLFWQLVQMKEKGGLFCHGFQLNIPWPDAEVLRTWKDRWRNETTIVLQVGSKAFAQIDHSPDELAKKAVIEYGECIDYLLLDPSGGTGKAFDVEKMSAYVQALWTHYADDHFGLGIAGGLSASVPSEVAQLLQTFDDLSVDAEGNLRDENDNLDISKTTSYIGRMCEIMPTE